MRQDKQKRISRLYMFRVSKAFSMCWAVKIVELFIVQQSDVCKISVCGAPSDFGLHLTSYTENLGK